MKIRFCHGICDADTSKDLITILFGPFAVRQVMSRRRYPRDVLNRLKWEKGLSLQNAEIVIIHRGAPGGRMKIPGKDVTSIGHMFFETPDASIPLHRVTEIWYRGEKIFDKSERRKSNE
jgi:uncharacterized protein (UPF0248 family)